MVTWRAVGLVSALVITAAGCGSAPASRAVRASAPAPIASSSVVASSPADQVAASSTAPSVVVGPVCSAPWPCQAEVAPVGRFDPAPVSGCGRVFGECSAAASYWA
jgi:hypothetical protein